MGQIGESTLSPNLGDGDDLSHSCILTIRWCGLLETKQSFKTY